MGNNYYHTLGIDAKAAADEIKRAYRKRAKQWHPDVNPATGATDQFIRINEAYDILSDPQKRAVYDHKLRIQDQQASMNSSGDFVQKTRARQREAEYQQWVRDSRRQANRHANMSYKDFKKTRFHQAEVTVFFYLQFLVILVIFGLGLMIMIIPFIAMYIFDWKLVFLALVSVPVAMRIFNEATNGLKELREYL